MSLRSTMALPHCHGDYFLGVNVDGELNFTSTPSPRLRGGACSHENRTDDSAKHSDRFKFLHTIVHAMYVALHIPVTTVTETAVGGHTQNKYHFGHAFRIN